MRFASTLLVLLVLSVYAWVRRKRPEPWGGSRSCLLVAGVLGFGVHVGDRLVTGAGRYPLLALVCAAVPVTLFYWLVLYHFFCRAVPKRRYLRPLYHGTIVLLVAVLGHLYPFRSLWPRLGGAPPPKVHLSALGCSAPIMSPRYNQTARKFGLQRVEITVLHSLLPTAQILSFRGDVAEINVTNRLLELLNEEEMVYVIAHELSHHRDSHYPLRLVAAGVTLIVFLTGLWWLTRRLSPAGDAPPEGGAELGLFLRLLVVDFALAALLALPLSAFCRSQEIQADVAAVRVTKNPNAAVAALEKLEEAVPGFVRTEISAFSNHPSTAGRIDAIKRGR